MHAQDAVLYKRRDRQRIEQSPKTFPEFDVIPSFALIPEPINPIDILTFMISSKQEHALRILNFQRKEQTQSLDGLLAPIHIISEKEIIALRRIPRITHETQQVEVLAMHIGSDCQGRLESEKHRLIHYYFTHVTYYV